MSGGRAWKQGPSTGTVDQVSPAQSDERDHHDAPAAAAGLAACLAGRLLPLFKRRPEEVGRLLPELYLCGLAHGDFDRALRGLRGTAAALSGASIAPLKASWQPESRCRSVGGCASTSRCMSGRIAPASRRDWRRPGRRGASPGNASAQAPELLSEMAWGSRILRRKAGEAEQRHGGWLILSHTS